METVPGWRRILRYRQIDGNGSSYLAVHEIESPAVFQTPEFQAATSTPWRDKVFGYVTRRERLEIRCNRGNGKANAPAAIRGMPQSASSCRSMYGSIPPWR